MPSFAELKAKAEGLKNTGVSKYQDTRDKHSSVPMKSTNWDPYDRKRPLGTPPQPTKSPRNGSPSATPVPPLIHRESKPKPALPPPPSRTGSSSSSAAAAPPSTPPAPAPRPAWRPPVQRAAPVETGMDKIDWANLSQDDKLAFFAWLDEFFEAFLVRRSAAAASTSSSSTAPAPPSRLAAARNENQSSSEPMSTSAAFSRFGANLNKGNVKALAEKARTNSAFVKMQGRVEEDAKPSTPKPSLVEGNAHGPPPPVAKWNKPSQVASSTLSSSPERLTMSYPPPATSVSHAADLASYFDASTRWSTPWYTSTSSLLPPDVGSRKDISYTGSWMARGTAKTSQAAVLFPDLSLCWTSVSYSTSQNADPNDSNAVRREAVWRDAPAVLDAQTLIEASETYGEAIAGFAESYVDSGGYCGRGECWDLAAHALNYVGGFTADGVPAPVPSISRTHGHLIFEGSANVAGGGLGRWRGEDRVIRRGDIVEWREVRIDRPGGGWSMLGNPDHTAVVVADAHPSSSGHDGTPIPLKSLGLTLHVAEQSVSTGIMPKRETYDVSAMTKGEVWVYRPVAWATYLGFEPEVEPVDEGSGGGAKAKIPTTCPEGLDVGRTGT